MKTTINQRLPPPSERGHAGRFTVRVHRLRAGSPTKETAAQPAAMQPSVQSAPAQAPAAGDLQRVVNEAYEKFKGDTTGKNADYIPYLASVPSNLFAVVIVTADGQVFSAGDIDYAFSIQSCSKVFTMCQVMEESGEDAVFKKIGVEPTGMPFNSVVALGMHNNKAVNPLVNAGAMASVSLVKASSAAERWDKSSPIRASLPANSSSSLTRFTNPKPRAISAIAASRGFFTTTEICSATRPRRRMFTPSNAPSVSPPNNWRSWAPRSPTAA